MQRAGEAHGRDAGVADQRHAGLSSEEDLEHAVRGSEVAQGPAGDVGHQPTGQGMRLMGLRDHRAPCGQRRCGVTTQDPEREWEVARPEDGNRTERDARPSEVRPRYGESRVRVVDDDVEIAPVGGDPALEPELPTGATELRAQPGLTEGGLHVSKSDDLVLVGFQAGREVLEHGGTTLSATGLKPRSAVTRRFHGGLDSSTVRLEVGGVEQRSGPCVDGGHQGHVRRPPTGLPADSVIVDARPRA